MSDKKYFQGKVIIITGASSGIGKALALEAAKQGADVVLAARTVDKLHEVSKTIESLGVKSLVVQTDVSVEQDAKKLVETTVEKFGKIDVLVNNAGISMRAMFDEMKTDVFKTVMDINFMGTVYCTSYALPHILKQKGSVVGISSIAGLAPLPARTAYSASKFAMFGFLTTLRTENIKRGLHVMISHPGFTESEIRKNALLADGSKQGMTPRNEEKMMTSEEVAIKVMKGIKNRKRVQIMTLTGNMTYFVNKLLPCFAHKMIYNTIAKEPDSPLPK
jgi:short-subunit dehydrogenase